MSHYTPPVETVDSGESVYFDGSASSTGAAEVVEMSGNFSVRMYIERSPDGGETWNQVSQLPTGTLKVSWHTEKLHPLLVSGVRRLRVDNKDKGSGIIELIGTEE